MATIATEPERAALSANPARAAQTWLVGPWFDCLLIANFAWPLLVLLQFGDAFSGSAGLQFWQIYYITTPHRWITLALVFLDQQQFRSRPTTFLAIAAVIAAVCLGVRFTTGALTCLLAIDYLWNAWHFAAQHHGIYRIYGRLGEMPASAIDVFEKWAMRAFLLYVILRVASATWSDAGWELHLRRADWLVLPIPAWLLMRGWAQPRQRSAGQRAYLTSMLGLYLAMLWAVHERRLGLVLSLAIASALFHALEYLALVSWTVQHRRKRMGSRLGALAWLAPRWAITLCLFMVILGAGGWLMDQHYLETWLTINVIVAFLHYAYDGLIWRRQAQ